MIASATTGSHLRSRPPEPLDPVARRYRAFFALLDWSQVPERAADRPWPGCPGHPRAAYIKALLVKLCEGKAYVTELRQFLVEHPCLVWELGFRPVEDPMQPEGFDVERTVPGVRWLRHQQQHLPLSLLHGLLRATVHALQAEIPGLGETVAVDVKHIYAWVQENNPQAYVSHRYDPTRHPKGDRDCRLGVKRRSNQTTAGGKAGPKEYVWGYGTGLISATQREYGDVVLAEWTQTFEHQDVTSYHSLYQDAVVTLERRPTNLAADAAFDAWHVYQTCAELGGLAAIPLNQRGHPPLVRNAAGHPCCSKGYGMIPRYEFQHEDGYRAGRFGCPLLHPRPTGQSCDQPQFQTGVGCVKTLNLELGGQARLDVDRHSAGYSAIYRQRTSTERINSQATALGIERPKVRQANSVRRLNTLTYVVINARALQRIRSAIPRPQTSVRYVKAHPPSRKGRRVRAVGPGNMKVEEPGG